jgi:peptidyl-prolyl cis-trans isomerase B (cyclophilin B)
VAVETNRGTMVFELFPEEAPLHVHNLLALAESGHYADTTFHRVELDFVIQGGDLRGDGAGGASWRGGPLQHEFGTRPYRRGSLGMPRWADPDSGGSQLFVTHRPTPHLDGRYTLFGQLVRGWDVLDAVEVGDRIRKVELLTP